MSNEHRQLLEIIRKIKLGQSLTPEEIRKVQSLKIHYRSLTESLQREYLNDISKDTGADEDDVFKMLDDNHKRY